MNKWHKLIPIWMLIALLGLMLLAGFLTSTENVSILTKVTKLLIIPFLLIFYFSNKSYMANVFFTIFLLTFLGDIFSVFNFNDMVEKLSKSMYLGSYLLLIFVLIGKLKRVKFEGLVSLYLIVVLIINTYFMYLFFDVVDDSFSDSVNLVLYVSRGITILVMGFLAFAVYLSKETTQSILFLTMTICFVFSDVLIYINELYVHYWLFESFEVVLHAIGLIILYNYILNHHDIIKKYSKSEGKSTISTNKHITA
jgi:hypothetical protein